ncbi:hypothetical protein HOP50_19g84260 [Chloropicon primus]|nr:hypothetical protein HOP50_19g84260 [Chloropicon primus]
MVVMKKKSSKTVDPASTTTATTTSDNLFWDTLPTPRKLDPLFFLLLGGAGAGTYFAFQSQFAEGSNHSESGIIAGSSIINSHVVTLEFEVTLNRKSLTSVGAISGAIEALRGNIEESLENFVVADNATTVGYYAQFSKVGLDATSLDFGNSTSEEVVFLDQCSFSSSSSGADVTQILVSNATATAQGGGSVVEASVDMESLPGLVASAQSGRYCVKEKVAAPSPSPGRRLLRRRLHLQSSADVAGKFLVRKVGARIILDIGASQSDVYTLEDKLAMTFESEALHLALVQNQVIQFLGVSATTVTQGLGGSNNGTTIMSGLSLKKDASAPSEGKSKYDEMYENYLEQQRLKEDNSTTATDGEAPPPGSPSGNSTTSTDEENSTSTDVVAVCDPDEVIPYSSTFLEFVESMRQKNEILDTIRTKSGNESTLLNDPLSLDWTKPPCAITDHTYYPAVAAFGGEDETGWFQNELACGRDYRKYDSETGIISTVKDTNLIAYFYNDGSLESLWMNETDWVYYEMGTVFFPGTHESNLTLWTMYEDDGKVDGVSRSIAPRWADVTPCQLYKNFSDCVSKAYETPLKLALVVLHWNDTNPGTIDMELMKRLYASEKMEKYWEGQSYGRMKEMEFDTFGPVNINVNEFYDIGEPEEEITFCVGEKAENGVLVREGGGCGMRGCTYISPNVMSGAYSSFDMATNISCIPGWRSENYFGTIFLTYSAKGCGGAGLFNSVFNIWIDGEMKRLRAISMSHLGPHERCDGSGENCVSYDHNIGNVEPRYINQTKPENWDHPLNESNLVETHELIHLFGIYWHSSARKCDENATDFRECRHREYGNEFSLVGGAGAALELPAHERYNLHFLNREDILVVNKTGDFQIGPISSALNARYRAALVVSDEYSLWLEYRRPVGYDTSLQWEDYKANTEGLMATLSNHLIDLNRGVPDETSTLFTVTLNSGYTWRPFGTKLAISNVVPLGDVGVNFTVSYGDSANLDSYGVEVT